MGMSHVKEKIISIIITLIGVIVVTYGLILCVMSNLNLGVILVAVLGIFIFCMGVFYKNIKKLTSKGFFKICKIIVISSLFVELLLVSFIAIYGVADNVDYNEDAIVVLGAGIRGDKVTLPLKMRLDKAVEYHLENPNAYIVVSGGQGFQETVTEAYAMKKYLVENGVNEDRILKEEKATSTYENMKYSKKILEKYYTGDYSVAIITNNFHIFRGATIAKQVGFQKVSHLHAGLQWYNLMPCFLRESLAVLKMIILG